MTVTVIPPGTTLEDGTPAPGLVTGLIDLATWYAAHPSAPMVTPRLNIPVPPGEPGARLVALDEIAEQLGTEVAERDGMLIAERKFGAVTVEAHVTLRAAGTSGRPARPGREIAQAGSEAAA